MSAEKKKTERMRAAQYPVSSGSALSFNYKDLKETLESINGQFTCFSPYLAKSFYTHFRTIRNSCEATFTTVIKHDAKSFFLFISFFLSLQLLKD